MRVRVIRGYSTRIWSGRSLSTVGWLSSSVSLKFGVYFIFSEFSTPFLRDFPTIDNFQSRRVPNRRKISPVIILNVQTSSNPLRHPSTSPIFYEIFPTESP